MPPMALDLYKIDPKEPLTAIENVPGYTADAVTARDGQGRTVTCAPGRGRGTLRQEGLLRDAAAGRETAQGGIDPGGAFFPAAKRISVFVG